MRRISKPEPPDNVSPEKQAPSSLLDVEKRLIEALASLDEKARPEHARARFDELNKKELRRVLHQDQRHLCVYCERRLKNKEGPKAPPIEHWRPLSEAPDKALHWENLYLSCRPTNVSSCDDSKANSRLVLSEKEDLPWPSVSAYEEWLGFTTLGEIYVRADARISEELRRALELAIGKRSDVEQKRKSVLNLNAPALCEARMGALDDERRRLAKAFAGKTATDREREEQAEELLRSSSYPDFVSIRVAWLRRLLGKHRALGGEVRAASR